MNQNCQREQAWREREREWAESEKKRLDEYYRIVGNNVCYIHGKKCTVNDLRRINRE